MNRESRPFFDHLLVKMVVIIPEDIKFSGGIMKYLFKNTYKMSCRKYY